MIVIPAIDIKGGNCVRLIKGDFSKQTIYSDNPLEVADMWFREGAECIHLVDLDGALEGNSINSDIFIKISKTYSGKTIQVGGGIRDLEIARQYLDNGIDRIIIGTRAVEDPGFISNLCDLYPNKIFLGVDSEEGFVKTKGWKQGTSIRTLDLIRRYNQFPLGGFIFTDISKDGMMTGPNFKATLEIASNTQLPVIASGGIASLGHIEELSKTGVIYGAITGKALYEKAFTLEEAIEAGKK
ncbi:MAG: 1-(5-phosphoribosyl)-5-[(5-phosphoribosylamino)methylideneamino]imidazole-4-carboxamide isomerase [Candidatus Marinimicrobia bacterium]|nr:1-(5-phosphoribosyl)-5-[(5-phosphoribosylamino)methylideneamino]imidazole-4-carboxamide isomerase [Candidatus Neomarinimicrobiota bacterium]|tara:strand:+ start:1001 stop:1723 length:723 start_codon:yes stop_codon:yes gene_type:complete